jgi:hypothetical protein
VEGGGGEEEGEEERLRHKGVGCGSVHLEDRVPWQRIQGSLRSRWSVEMTRFRAGL